eukprot:GEMP01021505.1.p1 GENE.GEMP01021505.1~~GEMP01021505.1.p1  ORF type:complete len:575 (+),score=142.30 GEMP01021505.1:128-1852(+)
MDSVKRQVEDSFTSDAKKVRRSRWGQAPEGPAAGDAVTLPEQGTLVPVGVAQAAMAPMGHMPHMGHMGNMMTMVSPMAMMGGMDLNAAAAAAREALEKAKKAAMFQKQIQEQMLRLKGGAVGAADAQQHARKLILDEFGRELTEEGKVLPMKPQIVSTLKVNQNLTMEKDAKKIIGEERRKMQKAQRDAGSSRWFDSDLKPSKTISDRRKNAFKFVEKGTFVKQEERMNQIKKEIAVAKAENLVSKEEKKAAAKDEKVAETKEAKPVINKSKLKEVLLPVPDIEWWDSLLCEDNMNPELPYVLKQDKITHLIEHPVQIKPRIEKTVTHTMHLTPQERKKLRRLRRQERTQQIRDKIKMGIIQPPPPKVKMSNLMRVLGDEAIADPSLVERKVKMQIEQRKKEHEARNESRKLPQQHLAAKKIQKWIEKDKDAVHVSLYRIKELTGKRCLFKIEMNAQQFQLTGICIICPGIGNLVVVEGGARAIKRYKKLMMKRIKWREDRKDDEASDSEEDEEQEDNQDCVCIWDGVVQNRGFKNWKSLTCKTDNEARKTLQDRGCEHYWDMLHRFRNVQEDI